VLVIGNTAALWPKFLKAIGARVVAPASTDPLESWVEAELLGALEDAGVASRASVYFAHAPLASGAFAAVQRAAALAGGALWLDEGSHLVVSAEAGPWISLRALVVLPLPSPLAPQPPQPNPIPAGAAAAAAAALDRALGGGAGEGWRLWLAVRDALGDGVPEWNAHRFTEEQIRYHYAGDRAPLYNAASNPP